MGLGDFLARHPLPAVIGGFGSLVGAWGFVSDARDLWTAGMKPEHLQLFGFALFVVSVVMIVMRQQAHIERQFGVPPQTLPTQSAAPAPESRNREPIIDRDLLSMLATMAAFPVGFGLLFLAMATIFRLIGWVIPD